MKFLTFSIFILTFSTTLFSETISPPRIQGVAHYVGKDRMIIIMPSGEETFEWRVHIDRKYLPPKYKNIKKGEPIKFVRTKKMVKMNAIYKMEWQIYGRRKRK